MDNTKEYAGYLHEGRPGMPGRWIYGFIDGDAKWLAQFAQRELGSRVKLR